MKDTLSAVGNLFFICPCGHSWGRERTDFVIWDKCPKCGRSNRAENVPPAREDVTSVLMNQLIDNAYLAHFPVMHVTLPDEALGVAKSKDFTD